MDELLFDLSPEAKLPLYEQLYRAIAQAIRDGTLAQGRRLPSKRALCAALGVSQNTVETAYGLLCAEGYLSARPRSGYYVCPLDRLPEGERLPAAPEPAPVPPPRWNFSTAAVDVHLFPFATWARLTKENLYGHPELLERGDPQGDRDLREALCRFLAETRGVRCAPEQLVLGAGVEVLLDLVCKLLPEETVYALEDPGYHVPYRVLGQNRREVVPLPLDSQGLSLAALRNSPAQVAYVTPSHQFPTGLTMPIGRRTGLLAWAAEQPERYLIEDDYDSEFRYASRPVPALQGLDRAGRVVYIGTFSRTIAPSIRVAYLVLPQSLLERYREAPPYAGSTVSRLEQRTLCRFLDEGYYARHLRRAAGVYRRRQQRLLAELSRLPGARIAGEAAGLHFLLSLPGVGETELLRRGAAAGLRLAGLGQYAHRARVQDSTLVLGFGGLGEEPEAAAAALRAALER